MEGFERVEYVEGTVSGPSEMGASSVDFIINDAPSTLYGLDRGLAGLALAGIHAGCYELFANERVQAIRDLKGKRVAIDAFGGTAHVFIASTVAYVGRGCGVPGLRLSRVGARSGCGAVARGGDRSPHGDADSRLAFVVLYAPVEP